MIGPAADGAPPLSHGERTTGAAAAVRRAMRVRGFGLLAAGGWGLAVASLVAVCVIAVRHTWLEADARGRSAANFAAVSANKAVHGVFETARVALDRSVELAIARSSGTITLAEMHARLDEMQAGIPDVVGIVVQDDRGVVTAAASPRGSLGRDLGNLDYFRSLAGDAARRYDVGSPYRSAVFDDVMVPLARAIRSPDGVFEGAVAVGIRGRALEEAMNSGVDDGTITSLWRSDGLRLAVRGPTGPETGPFHPDAPVFHVLRLDRDVEGFFSRSTEGAGRYAAWRISAQFPVFVTVSLDAAPHFSEANRVVLLAAALCALGFAIIGLLALIQHRRTVERERARADLGQRERRFRRLVETVPGVVLQWRRDAKGYGLVWVSPRSAEVLGISAGDLVRDPRLLRVHPDDRTRWFDAVEAIRGDEGFWSFSGRFVPPDGTVRDCVIKARTSRDADGAIVCDGILLDVTEEMRIRAAATETMARLSALFETAEDAIVTTDPAGRVIDFNPAAERVFGWPREAILGRGHEILIPGIAPAGREDPAEGGATDVAGTADPAGTVLRGWRRHDGCRRDGTAFPVALSFGRFSANGHAYGVAIARDMSDIEEAEERLRRANAELAHLLKAAEDANLAKSRFLSNMSHELRTPLNAVIGFADLMAEAAFGPHAHPKYAEYARDITDAGRHLLSLVNDILDLSRVADGNLEIVPTPVDPRRALVRAVRAIWPSVRSARLRLRVHAVRRAPLLLADQKALHQILLNLLSNAVKYTPPGGRIGLRLVTGEDGRMEIRVEDDGPGIRPEILDQIGRPFVRADDAYTSSRAGVGLGLAISIGLARAMGGDLVIRSRDGEGTMAILRMPAAGSSATPQRLRDREAA
jgi:two-component system cell cycle sensor histidine kinase PleC